MSGNSMMAAVQAAANGKDGAPAPVLAEQLAAARAEGVTEGRAAGIADGARAERDRILGIQGAAFSGQESLAGELIADGKTSPAEAALRFNADVKAKGPDHLAALRAADAHVRVPANTSAAGGAAAEPAKAYSATREGWMAQWKDTPALQRDYVTAEDYAADMKAQADGRVKVAPARASA